MNHETMNKATMLPGNRNELMNRSLLDDNNDPIVNLFSESENKKTTSASIRTKDYR